MEKLRPCLSMGSGRAPTACGVTPLRHLFQSYTFIWGAAVFDKSNTLFFRQ
jgi:hypothetical protein